MRASDISGPGWRLGGITCDTVLNVMHGVGYSKGKKSESIENNRAVIEATKAEEIAEHITLGKAIVGKLEAVEDDDERLGAVGNIIKPRVADMLVVYINTIIFQTS